MYTYVHMLIEMRLKQDVYAYNEGAPNRGALKVPLN